MPKRAPTNELTHDNWDQEDSDEETPGDMPVATDDQLKKRVILAAKRRSLNSNSGEKKLFSSFSGFNTQNKTTGDSGKNVGNIFTTSNKFEIRENSQETDEKETENPTNNVKSKEISDNLNGCVAKETISTSSKHGEKHKHRQLCKHLKVLNEGVLNWSQKHLKTNPYLDLRPVFQDYIKHYESLEEKFGTDEIKAQKTAVNGVKSSEEKKDVSSLKEVVKSNDTSSTILFGIIQEPTTTAATKPSTTFPSFNFGPQKNDGESGKTFSSFSTSNAAPSFSFGPTTTTTTTSSFGFFSSSTSNSNTLTSTETNNATKDEGEKHDDNEEYHPPEVESVYVEEKDAFFTIKCKLFYKSGQEFRERGVGMLYLKPFGDKVQIVVRADTSLGNILLNVALSPSMHITRTGKNNVSFICVPNPAEPKCYPADKPVMFLARVKTGENADELFENMTKKRD